MQTQRLAAVVATYRNADASALQSWREEAALGDPLAEHRVVR